MTTKDYVENFDTFFVLESLDWYDQGFHLLGPYISFEQVVEVMQCFTNIKPFFSDGKVEIYLHEVIIDTTRIKRFETIKTTKYILEHGRWERCI